MPESSEPHDRLNALCAGAELQSICLLTKTKSCLVNLEGDVYRRELVDVGSLDAVLARVELHCKRIWKSSSVVQDLGQKIHPFAWATEEQPRIYFSRCKVLDT